MVEERELTKTVRIGKHWQQELTDICCSIGHPVLIHSRPDLHLLEAGFVVLACDRSVLILRDALTVLRADSYRSRHLY